MSTVGWLVILKSGCHWVTYFSILLTERVFYDLLAFGMCTYREKMHLYLQIYVDSLFMHALVVYCVTKCVFSGTTCKPEAT